MIKSDCVLFVISGICQKLSNALEDIGIFKRNTDRIFDDIYIFIDSLLNKKIFAYFQCAINYPLLLTF